MSDKLIRRKQYRRLYIKRRLVFFVILPVSVLIIAGFICKKNFVINITDSIPKGIYKIKNSNQLESGDIVSVCLDDQKAKLAIQNKILDKNFQCQNGSQMLIKQIIAIPGDQVQVTKKQIKVIHQDIKHTYQASRFSFSPRMNKPVLTFISIGKYKSSGYWLYGSHNFRYSWDSRYFGQVRKRNIINKLKPILIF